MYKSSKSHITYPYISVQLKYLIKIFIQQKIEYNTKHVINLIRRRSILQQCILTLEYLVKEHVQYIGKEYNNVRVFLFLQVDSSVNCLFLLKYKQLKYFYYIFITFIIKFYFCFLLHFIYVYVQVPLQNIKVKAIDLQVSDLLVNSFLTGYYLTIYSIFYSIFIGRRGSSITTNVLSHTKKFGNSQSMRYPYFLNNCTLFVQYCSFNIG